MAFLEKTKEHKLNLEKLKKELSIKIEDLEKVQNDLTNANKKIQDMKKDKANYEQNIKENETLLHRYELNFRELNGHYDLYISLGTVIHNELNNIIKNTKADTFLVSGVQRDNLSLLWDFIAKKTSIYNQTQINVLIKIFEYFFKKYNEIYNVYEFLDVKEGDKFNSNLHMIGKDSLVSGNISKVVFRGYKNNRTQKIQKKSIVII